MKKLLLKFKKIFESVINKYYIFKSNQLVKKSIYPVVMDTDSTIDRLINSNCSMSRIGDGEFELILGESINYQKYDSELAKKLKEVLKSNLDNHIVCVSDVFKEQGERSNDNWKYWTELLKKRRYQYYKLMDLNKVYYNTSATRVYKLLGDKSLAKPRFIKLKQLWDNKDVVFIEGSQTRLGIGNDLFDNSKSIRRIIGPSENAYTKYNELLEKALSIEKSALFILALGPTATVLSYELAKRGYRALDLGHIDIEYEWFLKNNSDIAIVGKYVNEVSGGNAVDEINDSNYNKQIVATVD